MTQDQTQAAAEHGYRPYAAWARDYRRPLLPSALGLIDMVMAACVRAYVRPAPTPVRGLARAVAYDWV